VSISFVDIGLDTLEQSTIFELVSQYFGFSVDLGYFVSFFSIISFDGYSSNHMEHFLIPLAS
jgi:hypothetical protein